MKSLALVAVALATLTVVGISSAQVEWKQCVLAGFCTDIAGADICPPTEEHPAGLCTRCTNTETLNHTCSGVTVENPCFNANQSVSCGIKEVGVCHYGSCMNFMPSTTRCGKAKECSH